MGERKKILRKRSKNQHLKLEIVSFVRFEITSSFFHSLHSAVHSFIRSHVFCEFSCFRNAIDFFRSSARSLFRSFSTFSIRFHSLLDLVVQPFHPLHFDDRVAKNTQLQLSIHISFFCHNSFLFSISNLQNAFVFNRFCLRFYVKYVCMCVDSSE